MPELSKEEIKSLIEKSYNSRTNILKMMKKGEGHIGGAFSALDIITVIYNHILRFNPEKPKWKDRDRFILSAGHKVLALYAVLADAGYFSADNVARCEASEITPYISDHRERHNLAWEDRFKTLPPCPQNADAVTTMAHRLRTDEGRAIYAKRKSTVETVFGILKEVMGFRRFHLRGLDAAQGEWNLVCMAWNLKRMYALGG